MTSLPKHFHRFFAVLMAAILAAGPTLADRGDKADKHAEKRAEKADKRAGKAEQRAEKRAEKADKHDRKYAGKAGKHDRQDRRYEDVRIGAYFNDHHRQVARTYYTEHYGYGRTCPPGLAKKNNGCMPPGQAKKWALGQPLPAGVAIYAVPQPVLVQLPPPPYGYRYVRVGDDIVLVQAQNHIVIDIIYNLFG